jgi:hypothetical protein
VIQDPLNFKEYVMIANNYDDHIDGVREKCSVLKAELEKAEKPAARLEELREKQRSTFVMTFTRSHSF